MSDALSVLLLAIAVVYALFAVLMLVPRRFAPATMRRMPKVSAIIASRNEEQVIEAALKRLRKSSYPKLEVIVVDSSTDTTRAIARRYADNVIISRGGGKAAALNNGVRAATGELLYFLDADTLVERHTIRSLVASLDETSGCVVSAGTVLPSSKAGIVSYIGRLQLALFNPLAAAAVRLAGSAMLPGKNFIIFRKTLVQAGGFRQGLTEDINLSVRLIRRGIHVSLADAPCREQVPYTLRSYLTQQQRWLYGGLSETGAALTGRFVLLVPLVLLVLLAPVLSLAYLTLAASGNDLAAAAFVLGFLIHLIAARQLGAGDCAMAPLTFLAYGILQACVLVIIALKWAFRIPVRWERTEKVRYRAK
ncbi:MAG: glycosyltransferase family 2 protein [Candidatus Aenigmarchaeota archaeon]|nr:glycosyltransferase family 2 protein [Candidatus Aenigmarchaeota archaeon]